MINLCFDVGGMSTKIALIENNNIIKKDKIIYNTLINAKNLLKKLKNFIDKKIDLTKINNISISYPGIIDSKTGESKGLAAIIDHWKINLKKELEKKYNISIFIENDAKCAALAEFMIGNGKNLNNFFVMVIGTGIGGTVVIDRKIYKGKFLSAGEIGCFLEEIKLNKYLNLSNMGGMYNLENNYKKLTGKKLTGKEIYNLYNQDKNAKKLIDKQIFYISKAIINISFILDTEQILIGGAISENPLFMELINKKVNKLFNLSGMVQNIKINNCKFTNEANLYGANYLEVYNDKIS